MKRPLAYNPSTYLDSRGKETDVPRPVTVVQIRNGRPAQHFEATMTTHGNTQVTRFTRDVVILSGDELNIEPVGI